MSSARPALPLEAPVDLPPPDDWDARLSELGVTLDDEHTAQLRSFFGYLVSMNAVMNLTAIKDPSDVWTRHGLDALSLVPHLASEGELLDVGTGGGVPGVPLAIARPDLRVTLMDATQKKIAFLSSVADALGLANVKAVAGRAEQLARTPEMRGRFNVVVARAVARLNTLLGWTAPFVRPGGTLLLIKGQRADEELKEARPSLRRLKLTHDRTMQTPTGRIVVLRRADP